MGGMPIAPMRIAHRHTAARNSLAAAIAMLALTPLPALAEGPPELVLPLVTALALASVATASPRQVGTLEPGHRPLLSLLPSQLRFEDGYEIDPEDYVGRHRPVALVDADRIASFDFFHRARGGLVASFSYDHETRGPLARSGDVLRAVVEIRF